MCSIFLKELYEECQHLAVHRNKLHSSDSTSVFKLKRMFFLTLAVSGINDHSAVTENRSSCILCMWSIISVLIFTDCRPF